MFALLAVALLGSSPITERRVLLPFDYAGVRLTDGMLKRQQDEAKEFYLRIPNDDLLLGFRRRAGLPHPGHELGGWYGDDVFHVFGQILSGLARLYAATGDPECKEKADALLEGWAKTISPDGYFYYSLKPNAPHYIFDKMVGGLVDVATYCDRPDALADLDKITGWAEVHLDRSHIHLDGGEWYTLSENLYRAYVLTGNPRYARFAKVWEYNPYWNKYARNEDIFSPWPDGFQTNRYHAYSHVNTLGGAAMAYRVTGASRYLATIKNAYAYLQANEVFATGGFGPDESIVPKARLEQLLRQTHASFETQCGSWAVLKLCKQLIALTGDAQYGEWIEEVAYNGIGATIPMTADGNVFYYSDYNPSGGTKFQNPTQWTCCTGTRPMAVADLNDVTYFRAPDGLDVNLYLPSKVSFRMGREVIKVEQKTRFPENSQSEFLVSSPPATFALRLRVPAWSEGRVAVQVNGHAVSATPNRLHWITIKRKWHSGDRVDVTFPMTPRAVPLYSSKPYPAAVAVGPVVLAFRSESVNPAEVLDLKHLNLVPSRGEALTYHLADHPSILARPFYAYKQGEPYTLYLDPVAAKRSPYQLLRRSGVWNDSGIHYFSRTPGAFLEGTFSGDSLRVDGYLYDDAGKAEVKVDGKVVGQFDQYGPVRETPWFKVIGGLGPGKHTVRITVLGVKDAASKDVYVNIAAIGKG
jgi:hypothetical protein